MNNRKMDDDNQTAIDVTLICMLFKRRLRREVVVNRLNELVQFTHMKKMPSYILVIENGPLFCGGIWSIRHIRYKYKKCSDGVTSLTSRDRNETTHRHENNKSLCRVYLVAFRSMDTRCIDVFSPFVTLVLHTIFPRYVIYFQLSRCYRQPISIIRLPDMHQDNECVATDTSKMMRNGLLEGQGGQKEGDQDGENL